MHDVSSLGGFVYTYERRPFEDARLSAKLENVKTHGQHEQP